MTIESDPRSQLSESRKRLRVLASVLTTGVVIGLTAAIADARNPSGFLPTALGFVELLVCLFVLGTAVEMAREHSLRRLSVIALIIAATPFVLITLLELIISDGSGGHDATSFGVVYFVWACVASGLSLLLVAGVRFIIEWRKQRLSADE
jgi:hypothetical protein